MFNNRKKDDMYSKPQKDFNPSTIDCFIIFPHKVAAIVDTPDYRVAVKKMAKVTEGRHVNSC